MTDAATLTLTLDPDLLGSFVAEADAAMRPADDVLRDLVRDFVDRRRTARDVGIDRALREADDPGTVFVRDEEVEAEWLAERTALLRRIGDGAARRSVGFRPRPKAGASGSAPSPDSVRRRPSTPATGSGPQSGCSADIRPSGARATSRR